MHFMFSDWFFSPINMQWLFEVELLQASPPLESSTTTISCSGKAGRCSRALLTQGFYLLCVLPRFRAAERAWALLRLFDADGDGYLSFEEFRGTSACAASHAPPGVLTLMRGCICGKICCSSFLVFQGRKSGIVISPPLQQPMPGVCLLVSGAGSFIFRHRYPRG